MLSPTVKATTGGALEELGNMLGFDEDRNEDSSRTEDPNNVESAGGSLPIPNITQREEPPALTSSGSASTRNHHEKIFLVTPLRVGRTDNNRVYALLRSSIDGRRISEYNHK